MIKIEFKKPFKYMMKVEYIVDDVLFIEKYYMRTKEFALFRFDEMKSAMSDYNNQFEITLHRANYSVFKKFTFEDKKFIDQEIERNRINLDYRVPNQFVSFGTNKSDLASYSVPFNSSKLEQNQPKEYNPNIIGKPSISIDTRIDYKKIIMKDMDSKVLEQSIKKYVENLKQKKDHNNNLALGHLKLGNNAIMGYCLGKSKCLDDVIHDLEITIETLKKEAN